MTEPTVYPLPPPQSIEQPTALTTMPERQKLKKPPMVTGGFQSEQDLIYRSA